MAIFFYFFAFLLVLGSVMVITSRNPVYAVLWLIFTFCNASGIMVLMGAEFLAMMIIIIYVGAVAVLFLFVVMMLDIKLAEFKGIIGAEIGVAAMIAFFLFVDLVVVILLGVKVIIPVNNLQFILNPDIGNAYAIGRVLYTDFILPFQTAGLILFTAMIASISLTFRLRAGVKRQKPGNQLQKNKENSLFFAQNTGKSGLENLNYDD